MRPLLVLLERLWGPLRASLTALGASWGALGRVLRSSSGALGDVVGAREPLLLKMSSWSMANTVKNIGWKNLYEQEREASYRGSVFFRLG